MIRLLPTLLLLSTPACSGPTEQPAGEYDTCCSPDGNPPDPGPWVAFDREFTHPTRIDQPSWDEISLDGAWSFRTDPDDIGLADSWFDQATTDFGTWDTSTVPGVWNTMKPDLFRYKGVAWYETSFDSPTSGTGTFLEAGACFLRCSWWLNGEELGESERGYTPVRFEVGDRLRDGGNVLVVRVDNRLTPETLPSEIPTKAGTHGWYPYGGLHRSVRLVSTPRVRLAWADVFPPPAGPARIRIGLENPGEQPREVTVTAETDATCASGAVLVEPGIHHFEAPCDWPYDDWDPDNPITGKVTIRIGGVPYEIITGRRAVEVQPSGLYVNGVHHYLNGISRHEDMPETGTVQTDTDLEMDLALLQDLGVVFIRPGHYPADPRWLDILRDNGILIVEEIPVYQLTGDQMASPAMLAKAKDELAAMIERDRNNPAIVAWSLMNEIDSWDPDSGPFAEALAAYARELDPTRPLFYADSTLPAVLVGQDFVAQHVDIVGLNLYHGWYYGDADSGAPDILEMMDRYPGKPFLISEFGAGAGHGMHLPDGQEPGPENVFDHSYTEEFQAWFLDQHLRVYSGLPLAGVMPWAFADFRMEWVTPTGQAPEPFMNFKGLLSHDRQKKLAFDVVRSWYYISY